MFKRFSLVIFFLILGLHTSNANQVTEKDLLIAIDSGVESTEKFLEKVPTYQLYEKDKTILHYAVSLQKYDVIEMLVNKNLDLSLKGGMYHSTALHDAIYYKYFRIAKLLINNGSPLDVKNINGETALHIASKNGYASMIKMLIANGASKNVYDKNDNRPYDVLPKFMWENHAKLKEILQPKKQNNQSDNPQLFQNGINIKSNGLNFELTDNRVNEFKDEKSILINNKMGVTVNKD